MVTSKTVMGVRQNTLGVQEGPQVVHQQGSGASVQPAGGNGAC